jgi:hypothetical protein
MGAPRIVTREDLGWSRAGGRMDWVRAGGGGVNDGHAEAGDGDRASNHREAVRQSPTKLLLNRRERAGVRPSRG